MTKTYRLFILLALICLPNVVISQETQNEHSAGVFLGASLNENTSDIDPNVGVEYEYFLDNTKPQIGIGINGDATIADDLQFIGTIMAYIHPSEELRLSIGGGVNIFKASTTDPVTSIITKKNEAKSLFRIGVLWSIDIESFKVQPNVRLDIIENNALIKFGISIAYGF